MFGSASSKTLILMEPITPAVSGLSKHQQPCLTLTVCGFPCVHRKPTTLQMSAAPDRGYPDLLQQECAKLPPTAQGTC